MLMEEYLIESDPTPEELIAATRLTRDLKASAKLLTADQSRYLVDLYYTLQRLRIAAAAQVRSAEHEPNMLIGWTCSMYEKLETDVKGALEQYAKSQVPGQWALSIKGIGPVIAAGLLAHVDILETPAVSSLWRFAGYDPTVKWNKGQKRPWNARLKVLGWKIGQSFVKSSGRDGSFYGPLYKERKAYEIERNERGDYAEQAERILTEKRIGKETDAYAAYSVGKLPPAHIQARAERFAVKLFLAHFWNVCYESTFQVKPPRPYALAHLEHVHEIAVPNWPFQADYSLIRQSAALPVAQPPKTTWGRMKEAYEYRCAYCELPFPDEELTRDHVIPTSKGGPNTWTNIVPACLDCNREKDNQIWHPRLIVADWPLIELSHIKLDRQ